MNTVENTGERFRRIFSTRAWERLQQEGMTVIEKSDLQAQLEAYNRLKEENAILHRHIAKLEQKRRKIGVAAGGSNGQAGTNSSS